MAGRKQAKLYDQIVRVTNVYLGPAAERFVMRQVESHLHKPPTEITDEDLSHLIIWIRLAVSLLTDDIEIIDEYVSQLEKLTAR